jgi:hypothetical protein
MVVGAPIVTDATVRPGSTSPPASSPPPLQAATRVESATAERDRFVTKGSGVLSTYATKETFVDSPPATLDGRIYLVGGGPKAATNSSTVANRSVRARDNAVVTARSTD